MVITEATKEAIWLQKLLDEDQDLFKINCNMTIYLEKKIRSIM